jgi:hypothetical protein
MNRRVQLALVLILQIGSLILIGYECQLRERWGLSIWPQLFLAVIVIFLGAGHIRKSGT